MEEYGRSIRLTLNLIRKICILLHIFYYILLYLEASDDKTKTSCLTLTARCHKSASTLIADTVNAALIIRICRQ